MVPWVKQNWPETPVESLHIIGIVVGVWLAACLVWFALAYIFGKDQPPDVDDGLSPPWEMEIEQRFRVESEAVSANAAAIQESNRKMQLEAVRLQLEAYRTQCGSYPERLELLDIERALICDSDGKPLGYDPAKDEKVWIVKS
jgi:hypothetical protein